MNESRARSLVKALSWRLIALIATALVAAMVTHDWAIGAIVGACDSGLKLALYFGHERAWQARPWGVTPPPGCVVWLTGLPCSGKTTIARLLEPSLRAWGRPVVILDGDTLRATLATGERAGLNCDLGFSPDDRHENLRRIREMAHLLELAGAVAIVAAITPYEEDRVAARLRLFRLLLVYVYATPETCESRDVKGMWARARAGEIADFTGLTAPFEFPDTAGMTVDAEAETEQMSAARVFANLKARGWL